MSVYKPATEGGRKKRKKLTPPMKESSARIIESAIAKRAEKRTRWGEGNRGGSLESPRKGPGVWESPKGAQFSE